MQMCAPRPISFHKTPLNFVINAFGSGRGPHWFACLVVGHWISSFLMPFLIPRRKSVDSNTATPSIMSGILIHKRFGDRSMAYSLAREEERRGGRGGVRK